MRGNDGGHSTQGLALNGISAGRMAAMRSRMKSRSREITERRQVGDAESMINEEPANMLPGSENEWHESNEEGRSG